MSEFKYLHQYSSAPYRSDRGVWLFRTLFFEESQGRQDAQHPIQDALGGRSIFTLKTYDHTIRQDSVQYRSEGCNTLRSLHLEYLAYSDPSEWEFAEGTFGIEGSEGTGWDHWTRLIENEFFTPYLTAMRVALATKMDSETVRQAKAILDKGEGNAALQAAKWLNDRVRKVSKRGRPSNAEVETELKRRAEQAEDLDADRRRLGLDG